MNLQDSKANCPECVGALRGRYYEFALDKFEGRYWNSSGYGCAVVASIGIEGAWAAYIGGAPGQREEEDLDFVARRGAKLSEKDARHFFPEIELPYRN